VQLIGHPRRAFLARAGHGACRAENWGAPLLGCLGASGRGAPARCGKAAGSGLRTERVAR
jgi:hypothetical protein